MPVRDGLPVSERRRHVPPRNTTTGPPKHPIEHRTVIGPPSTPTRGLVGQQRLHPGPLRIGQIVSMQHPPGLPHPALKIRGTRSSGLVGQEVTEVQYPANRCPSPDRAPLGLRRLKRHQTSGLHGRIRRQCSQTRGHPTSRLDNGGGAHHGPTGPAAGRARRICGQDDNGCTARTKARDEHQVLLVRKVRRG